MVIIPIPSNVKKPVWIVLTVIAIIGLLYDFNQNQSMARVIYFLIIWGVATALFFRGNKKIF